MVILFHCKQICLDEKVTKTICRSRMLFLVCTEALRLGTMATRGCKTFLKVRDPRLGDNGEKKEGKVGLTAFFL